MKHKKFWSLLLISSLVFTPSMANADSYTNESGVFKNIHYARFQGENRSQTAVKVSRHYFGNARKVILVNSEAYPDAISATNVSIGKYPLLYTSKSSLPSETSDALSTMIIDEVYLLGGENSIGNSVKNSIKKLIPNVKITRISGMDRYDTSSESAKLNHKGKENVNLIFAAGTNYADALYATSLATHQNAPILLVNNEGLKKSTVDYINSFNSIRQITIVGGENSVSEKISNEIKQITGKSTITRLAGHDRYDSSVEVAKKVNPIPKEVITTSGENFADALVSSTVAQKTKSPILLVRKDKLSDSVRQYLHDTNSISKLTIIGGYNTITKNNQSTQVILLSGFDVDKEIIDKNGVGLIKAFTKNGKKYYCLPDDENYQNIKQYDKLFVYIRDALAEGYRPIK